jgi:hypothetical protein
MANVMGRYEEECGEGDVDAEPGISISVCVNSAPEDQPTTLLTVGDRRLPHQR